MITPLDILSSSFKEIYGNAVQVQNHLVIPELNTEIIVFRFYKGIEESPIDIFGNILKIERKNNDIYRISFSKNSNFIIETTDLSVGLFQIISLYLEYKKVDKIWTIVSDLNGV